MSSAWLWVSFLALDGLVEVGLLRRPRSRPAARLDVLALRLGHVGQRLAGCAAWSRSSALVRPRYFAAAAASAPNGRARPGAPPRPPDRGSAAFALAMSSMCDFRLGEHVVGLALRELLVRHGLVEFAPWRRRGSPARGRRGPCSAPWPRRPATGRAAAWCAGRPRSGRGTWPRRPARRPGMAWPRSPGHRARRAPGPPGPNRPKPGPPRTPLPASMRFLSASACAWVMRPAARSALTWSIGGRLGGVLELLRADPEVLGHRVQEVRPVRA